ncbi:MAG: TetR/AcrR family transcriptional regulator [Deltaproteobacteria bacterium]|nr:TetR/AcrR family transcriptional regulator [Deltaproteobacteria bacterium]
MPKPKKSETRKEQILRAAEQVFAQKGFQEATVSDVARKAGLSDATIYEYFPSKEELLFSIPGQTARRSRESMEHLLNHIRGASNKIRAIIYGYLWFYETHPDYAAVAMLVLKQNRNFLKTAAYEDVRELTRLILRVIEEGIAGGEFRPDINPYVVRSAILGAIEHLVIRGVLLGIPENLVELVDPLTDLIVAGIRSEEATKTWNFQLSFPPQDKKGSPKTKAGGTGETRQR